MGPTAKASLSALPAELIDTIFDYLPAQDLARVACTCKAFHVHSLNDKFWHAFVQSNLSREITSTNCFESFRDLYIAHYPNWFLPRFRIWFSDSAAHGRLIFVRYNTKQGCIEGYTVVADRGQYHYGMLPWNNGTTIYNTFDPKVQLDLNRPILRLWPRMLETGNAMANGKFTAEVRMDCGGGGRDRMCTTFLRSKPLPETYATQATAIWPPPQLPSPNNERTRNESTDTFHSAGHKPNKVSDATESSFRIRQWLEFSHFFPVQVFGSNGRVGEICNTYGTVPCEMYTPSKEKPLQGIWCGDYSAHGCEFLLLMEPDMPRSMPLDAQKALKMWPRTAVDHDHPMLPPKYEDDEESLDLPEDAVSLEDSSDSPQKATEKRPKHRLEAIKLTGDPNVPRCEYTFIAEDISENGLVGRAREHIFKPSAEEAAHAKHMALDMDKWQGAPCYKAVSHIAQSGFINDAYIPSQLIVISEDRIAHYWQDFAQVRFYRRVNLDRLLDI